MHVFDLSNYLQNINDAGSAVICTKVNLTEGVPSTRWGHAAATLNEKLYILGGRNEQDVNDLHEFDYNNMKWSQVELNGQMPRPRRRHSALFVSGTLIMFGGFDGSFFNDMHLLDFQKSNKQTITISPSSLERDYLSLVNNPQNADIVFSLENNQLVYGHKSLILFRSMDREIRQDLNTEIQLSKLMKTKLVPEFFSQVYYIQKG